jgi:hypothetical protein
MNNILKRRVEAVFFAIITIIGPVSAQTTRPPPQPSAGKASGAAPVAGADDQTSALASAQQTAQIFGLDKMIERVRELQAERGTNTSLTEEERSLRLDLLESFQMATLDVDRVLGEISNERNQLGDLRASSESPNVKVSIDDLTNRMAMLGDVEGRVELIRRDLLVLMSSYIKDFRK